MGNSRRLSVVSSTPAALLMAGTGRLSARPAVSGPEIAMNFS
jgi:hypothetical protein